MGVLLIAISALVFVTTGLVAFLDLHTALLLIPAVVGIGALVAGAYSCSLAGDGSSGSPTTATASTGPRGGSRHQRGGRTSRTRSPRTSADSPVVVLRLRSGETTTIPVEMLAGDREEFVRDLVSHLQQGQGLRKL